MTFFYDLNKRLAAVNDAPETKQLNERDMSRAAKGIAKYTQPGMEELSRLGRKGASKAKMDAARKKYDQYDNEVDEGAYQAGPDKSQIPAVNRPGNRMTLQDLEKERTQSPTSPEGLKRANQQLSKEHPIKEKMNPAKQKSFAALAPPYDKKTFADKIAGAKKEVDEMLGDVAAEAMKSALSGRQKTLDKNDNGKLDANDFAMLRKGGKQKTADKEDLNPFTNYKKPRAEQPKRGSVEQGSKHDIKHDTTDPKYSGRIATRRVDDQGNSVGSDTDDEGNIRDKRSAGRPKGAAKGTERVTSKAIKHKGEREKKGSAGAVSDAGKSLQGFMIGNKPKNEPGKLSVRNKMKEGDADPTDNDSGDLKAAMALLKKAGYKVSKSEEKESTADRDDHAEKAGKKFTKDVEDSEKNTEKKPKKKEKTEEAGGTGTPTASSGFGYGKGIYDSLNRDVENAINESMQQLSESMSINMSDSSEGGKSLTITATDQDALKLATLLKSAGLGGGDAHGHDEGCPQCGQSPCGCDEVGIDEVSMNEPDYPTNTETGSSMQYSGGLDGPKTGQSTMTGGGIPNLDPSRQDSYADVEEDALHRMMEMAGITNEAQSAAQKAAFKAMIAKKNGGKSEDKADDKDDNKKPDEDGDGIPDWVKGEKKVDEGILASTRALWKKYQE